MAEETDTNDKATMESIAQNILEVRVSRDQDSARQRNSAFRSVESVTGTSDAALFGVFLCDFDRSVPEVGLHRTKWPRWSFKPRR